MDNIFNTFKRPEAFKKENLHMEINDINNKWTQINSTESITNLNKKWDRINNKNIKF